MENVQKLFWKNGEMKKRYYLLVIVTVMASILVAYINKEQQLPEQIITAENLRNMQYQLRYVESDNDSGSTQIPTIAQLKMNASEILKIKALQVCKAGEDIQLKAVVTGVIQTSEGICADTEINIYMPVYINTKGIKYALFSTYMNIPQMNKEYLVYLKPYIISEKYKNTFLFSDRYVSMFPCDGDINIKVLEKGVPLEEYHSVIACDYIVDDERIKAEIEELHIKVSDYLN